MRNAGIHGGMIGAAAAVIAALMTECYGKLFLSIPRERPYALPFSHFVWAAGSVLLVLLGILWITVLCRLRRHRPAFAVASVLTAIPVYPVMLLVWDALWAFMHRTLPAIEQLFA